MKDFNFKKSLGQNFLIDNNIKKKIIESADIDKDSLIIEVGAGEGALTKLLVNFNVPVISFEIDIRLKEKLYSINSNNLTLIFEDFLTCNLKDILSNYKDKKVSIIANLPYYITTAIINKIMEETSVYQMIIMVQKEVGDRFKAKVNTKEYNSLSIFLQYYFNIEKVTNVSKNSFIPKPKVDSVVIKFTRKETLLKLKNTDMFFKFVRDAFRQKRKNLRNNLKEYDLVKIEKELKNMGKDLTYRAEQISLEEFVRLANLL